MFNKNILPIGESNLHLPIEDCPCNPKVIVQGDRRALLHFSFDHRELWLAVEQMLGMTCYEHMLFVDDTYERGNRHGHLPKPEPYFEYKHEKIDPR